MSDHLFHKHGLFIRTAKKLFANLGLLLILFLICLWALMKIADMVFDDKNDRFDQQVFSFLDTYYNPSWNNFFNSVTFLGSAEFLLPANILLVLIFVLYKKKSYYSWKIAIISITGTTVMFLLKELLQRQRPLVPLISKAHGFSFPSGHSFSSLLFFGMLAYMVYRSVGQKFLKWILIFLLCALIILIGLSRIWLKVHYATDVTAGFILGIIWLILAKWILVDKRKNLPPGNETLIG